MFRNMHFCVIQYIDCQKQSLKGSLKVLGKSLRTVLGEVHFENV